jgi:hypothetical protein
VVVAEGPTIPKESLETLKRLSSALAVRALALQRYDDYYRGVQGRRFMGTKYRELFAKLFDHYCENFCGVVVDAVEERLDVEGFTFPESQASDPGGADKDAWRIWQDNQLDATSQIAHTEALVKGVVYALVSPFAAERVAGRSPRITIEDPIQTIIEYAPGTRERLVGLKRWSDPLAKLTYATLYWPDRIEKFQAAAYQDIGGHWRDAYGRFTPAASFLAGADNWVARVVEGETWPLPHALGVVPLVPLINRPRLAGEGESEISDVIAIQDAINTLAINELVASETAAFPQKWATGIEIPLDPETGKPAEPWKPDIERILSTPVPDAKFGQFSAADLEQYGAAIDRRVKRIASISRTPYHYFLDHGGQPPSGESIKSAETGLVRKARRKHRHFGEGWEEVIRLAFKALDDPRSEVLDSETDWSNPESMTESEHIDALVKQLALGVPKAQLQKEIGYTPTQIANFPAMHAAEDAALPSEPPPPMGQEPPA